MSLNKYCEYIYIYIYERRCRILLRTVYDLYVNANLCLHHVNSLNSLFYIIFEKSWINDNFIWNHGLAPGKCAFLAKSTCRVIYTGIQMLISPGDYVFCELFLLISLEFEIIFLCTVGE